LLRSQRFSVAPTPRARSPELFFSPEFQGLRSEVTFEQKCYLGQSGKEKKMIFEEKRNRPLTREAIMDRVRKPVFGVSEVSLHLTSLGIKFEKEGALSEAQNASVEEFLDGIHAFDPGAGDARERLASLWDRRRKICESLKPGEKNAKDIRAFTADLLDLLASQYCAAQCGWREEYPFQDLLTDLDNGELTLETASELLESFREWLGKEKALLAYGEDTIRRLREAFLAKDESPEESEEETLAAFAALLSLMETADGAEAALREMLA
jgi:hypothetical protein